TKSCYLY
ncbi:hypothetical protein CP082626L3_0829B, partial [Chlamydia psittaci 08-2626_L3]